MNSSPLTFEERKGEIVGLLGVIVVAEIFAVDRDQFHGNRIMWNFWLRGHERKYVLAADTDSAKAAVQDHATSWLRAAALRPMTSEELEEDRENEKK